MLPRPTGANWLGESVLEAASLSWRPARSVTQRHAVCVLSSCAQYTLLPESWKLDRLPSAQGAEYGIAVKTILRLGVCANVSETRPADALKPTYLKLGAAIRVGT